MQEALLAKWWRSRYAAELIAMPIRTFTKLKLYGLSARGLPKIVAGGLARIDGGRRPADIASKQDEGRPVLGVFMVATCIIYGIVRYQRGRTIGPGAQLQEFRTGA